MSKFDAEEQVGLFFRCMMNQISLMEMHYIDETMDKMRFLDGISKFYELMVRINVALEFNGHRQMKFLIIGREGNS